MREMKATCYILHNQAVWVTGQFPCYYRRSYTYIYRDILLILNFFSLESFTQSGQNCCAFMQFYPNDCMVKRG